MLGAWLQRLHFPRGPLGGRERPRPAQDTDGALRLLKPIHRLAPRGPERPHLHTVRLLRRRRPPLPRHKELLLLRQKQRPLPRHK